MKVCVEFEWKDAGRVRIGPDGKLLFPRVLNVAGIYRLSLRDRQVSSVYVGETDNLKRRMQNYRTPGPRQRTSLRLHRRIQDVLEEAGTVELAIATNAALSLDRQLVPWELSKKPFRRLLESATLVHALGSGCAVRVENL